MASYVAPELREKFETLSIELKNDVLKRNVQLHTIHDLIHVLEEIYEQGRTINPIPEGVWESGRPVQEVKSNLSTDLQGNGYPDTRSR